jgi:DnaK suppressor protein
MVCHETYEDQTNRWLSPEEVTSEDGKKFYKKDNLSEEGLQRPDIADRAQVESDASIQLRTRDRERKLISKIDAALRRVDLKTYGYCEETGEPIGLGRLKARPIASLSVDAQERHEKKEKIHKDE